MKTVILSALVIASVLSKGPCDTKKECYEKQFQPTDRALCTGFRACAMGKFRTDNNMICSGHQSCMKATIKQPPPKILCNGFEACRGMKDGFTATEKIACNGLKACQDSKGTITAPMVTCDGALGCVDQRMRATGDMPKPKESNVIICNGNKACAKAALVSDGKVECDGDISCQSARIKANKVTCAGKRGCYGSTIVEARFIEGVGFNAAAEASITGPKPEGKNPKPLEIKALGMNALMGATINNNGADMTILGYGFKALVGAKIECMEKGAKCEIKCVMNACKKAEIYVDRGARLKISPAECDPRDDNFVGYSKKSKRFPARYQGVHCPRITGPGVRAEDDKLTVEEWELEADTVWKESEDYMEMIEAAQIAEESLDAIIAEQVQLFEANLEMPEEEEFMVAGHTVSRTSNTSSNNVLQSNITTAVTVFILTSIGSLCYIACRFEGKGEYQALLQ